MFKPATSKSGNSEVYVICTDMQSMDAGLRSELYKLVGKTDKTELFASVAIHIYWREGVSYEVWVRVVQWLFMYIWY